MQVRSGAADGKYKPQVPAVCCSPYSRTCFINSFLKRNLATHDVLTDFCVNHQRSKLMAHSTNHESQDSVHDHASLAPEVNWQQMQPVPEVYRYDGEAPEVAPYQNIKCKACSRPKCDPASDRPIGDAKVEELYTRFSDPRDQPRKWCGLRRRTAILAAAVLLAVAIGGIVGGAVGGNLVAMNRSASQSASTPATPSSSQSTSSTSVPSSMTPSATITPTATSASNTPTPSSSAVVLPSNGILPLDCPAINNTLYTSSQETFRIYCLTDLGATDGIVGASLQATLDDCIDACATKNANNASTPCQGLTFGADLSRQVKPLGCEEQES